MKKRVKKIEKERFRKTEKEISWKEEFKPFFILVGILLLLFLVLIFFYLSVTGKAIGELGLAGSGTSEDPYIITDCSQFQEAADSGAYFILQNGIDCSLEETQKGVVGNAFEGVLDWMMILPVSTWIIIIGVISLIIFGLFAILLFQRHRAKNGFQFISEAKEPLKFKEPEKVKEPILNSKDEQIKSKIRILLVQTQNYVDLRMKERARQAYAEVKDLYAKLEVKDKQLYDKIIYFYKEVLSLMK